MGTIKPGENEKKEWVKFLELRGQQEREKSKISEGRKINMREKK